MIVYDGMSKEIERKFLVKADVWRKLAGTCVRMRQGYVPTESGVTVRARIAGDKAFLTLKSRATGLARDEFEYEIPVPDAERILDTMCSKPQIDKIRYRIPADNGLVWEVDEFLGENAPLVTAEIELPDERTAVEVPAWIGLEVTDDHRYKNNNLAAKPYSGWGP